MKKIIFRIIMVLIALPILYIIFNQFDSKEVQSEFFGKSYEEIFCKPDYSKSNGYYRLYTLTEPKDVDTESDEVYMRYRKLHDPKFDNKKYVIESKKWKKSDFIVKYNNITKKYKNADDWFTQSRKNSSGWCKRLLRDKENISKLKTISSVYLKRYQKLIESEVYEDIINLNNIFFEEQNKEYDVIEYSTLPNLLLWLKLGKTYNVIHALDAMEGNWERGMENLINHINFLRKGGKTNKILITNLINKAIMRMTIITINNLLNNKNCPKEMSELVLNMPDIKYEEYGSKSSFIAETVFLMGKMFSNDSLLKKEIGFFYSFLLQKNRTLEILNNGIRKLLYFDKTSPYLWTEKFVILPELKKDFFWWLQNPAGKTFIKNNWANLKRVVSHDFELKAMFDMLKISAELRLKFTGEKPVKEVLKELKTYNSLIDLCSGKPYKWNMSNNQFITGTMNSNKINWFFRVFFNN